MVDKQVPEGMAASNLFQGSEERNAMLLGSMHSARPRVHFFVFDPTHRITREVRATEKETDP